MISVLIFSSNQGWWLVSLTNLVFTGTCLSKAVMITLLYWCTIASIVFGDLSMKPSIRSCLNLFLSKLLYFLYLTSLCGGIGLSTLRIAFTNQWSDKWCPGSTDCTMVNSLLNTMSRICLAVWVKRLCSLLNQMIPENHWKLWYYDYSPHQDVYWNCLI